MEYLTFVEELKKHILKNEKWNISEENYKFIPTDIMLKVISKKSLYGIQM